MASDNKSALERASFWSIPNGVVIRERERVSATSRLFSFTGKARDVAEVEDAGPCRLRLVMPYRVVSVLSATRNARTLVPIDGTKARSRSTIRTKMTSTTWVAGGNCFNSSSICFRFMDFPFSLFHVY